MSDDSPQMLTESLIEYLTYISTELGVNPPDSKQPAHILRVLVRELAKKERVVILIDEYDSPLVTHLEDPELSQANRMVLQKLFAILKTLQGDLRFVLLTGVSRFSKVSLFSGLNSLTDISLDADYAALLGLTESEIQSSFDEHITRIGSQQGVDKASVITEMRRWYNGYRFARDESSESVYNPWSVLNYLRKGELENYWFASATPTFAIQLIRQKNFPIPSFEEGITARHSLDLNNDSRSIPLTSLLYQTGYLTISKYDHESRTYTLRPPNEEVNRSLLEQLFVDFVRPEEWEVQPFMSQLHTDLQEGDLHGFFEKFNQLLAGVPYHLHETSEAYYHSLLYLCVRMLGFDVTAEAATNRGRIDLVVKTPSAIYLLEFKIDSSARKALKQIKEMGYGDRFGSEELPVILVGANFSSKKRQIDDWHESRH